MTRMPCSVWRIRPRSLSRAEYSDRLLRVKCQPMTETALYLNLHVPPDEMVKYIQDLMTLPHGEIAASSAMT